MVVKSVRGRRRYIAFEAPMEANRETVLGILSSHENYESMRAITCRDGWAVVRCSPGDSGDVIGILSGKGFRSVSTSGTLRALRDRYPVLRVPRLRRR